MPANNFLTGIVYGNNSPFLRVTGKLNAHLGDYYYIKAGNDLISMSLAKCT